MHKSHVLWKQTFQNNFPSLIGQGTKANFKGIKKLYVYLESGKNEQFKHQSTLFQN